MKVKNTLFVSLIVAILIPFGGVIAGNDYAVDFEGNSSVYVVDDASDNLDIGSAYTIEMWLYLETYQQYDRMLDRRGVFAFEIIAPTGSGAGHDYGISFEERSASTDAVLRSITTNSSDEDMALNTWYHVAVTFDGSDCRLFVDETQVGLYSSSLWGLLGSSNNLNIGGRYWDSYGYQMDGKIDELRISNIARDIGDMQTSTSDAAYTSDVNTVLLMHFDDQSAPPTYISGTGLTGSTGDDPDFSTSNYVTNGDLSLPVELNYFSGKSSRAGIELSWETASEIENLGYIIQRSTGDSKTHVEIASYLKNQELAGQGSSTETNKYTWTDTDVEAGMSYSYTLLDVDYQGQQTSHKPIDVLHRATLADLKPHGFTLSGIYPNPFNPSTSVSFNLAEPGAITIAVHNARGQLVQTLASDRHFDVGEYSIQWQAQSTPAGIYFITFSGMGQTQSSKVVKLD